MTKKVRAEFFRYLVIEGFSTLASSFVFVSYMYYLRGKGLNLFEIGSLATIYNLVMIFLQIPTGALADVWGRKRAYIVSLVILFVGAFIYMLAPNFTWFVIAEILWAVASSLYSGCVEAHIWESISTVGKAEGFADKDTEDFNKKFSVASSIVCGVVSAIGGFLGAQIAVYNQALPWIGSMGCTALAIVVGVMWFKDDKAATVSFKEDIKKMYLVTLGAARQVIRSEELMEVVVLVFLIKFAIAPFFTFWEIRALNLNGNNIAILGYVWILIEVFSSIGSVIAERLNRKVNEKKILVTSLGLLVINGFLLSISKNFIEVISFVLLLEIVSAMIYYSYSIRQQKEISVLSEGSSESSLRATILSLLSVSGLLGVTAGQLSAGYIGDHYSINASWIMGTLIGAVAIIVALMRHQKRKEIGIETTVSAKAASI